MLQTEKTVHKRKRIPNTKGVGNRVKTPEKCYVASRATSSTPVVPRPSRKRRRSKSARSSRFPSHPLLKKSDLDLIYGEFRGYSGGSMGHRNYAY